MRSLSSLVSISLAAAALLSARPAAASPCPSVMIILDRSGSMDQDPSGGSSTPSKLDIAKTTLNSLVAQYGDQLPFGFTDFAATGFNCGDGVEVLVKPKHGTKADVTSAITAVMTAGSTNTGPAIDDVVALPEMHDMTRPGSYIILVTDGEPNCPGTVGTETTDPEYTVGAVQRAAMMGIKTFVIGFGALPQPDKDAMNMMAMVGGEPCSGAACNGQKYYAAESSTGLQAAITAISSQIVGEFGGACDDSCYANGCMNAGEICVQGACKADPCTQVATTCAPGDYCYTDGSSVGQCAPVCPAICPAGQGCTLTGCQPDPCATLSCAAAKMCINGSCVTNTCAMSCANNLFCIAGTCQDDPCRYIKCPTGSACTAQLGTCVATSSGNDSGTTPTRGGGCHFAPGEHADQATLVLALFALAFVLTQRRRRSA